MIISIEKKHLTNVLIKTCKKLGIKEKFVNLIKGIYEKSTVHIVLNSERLDASSLKLGARQGCIVLEGQARIIRQEK